MDAQHFDLRRHQVAAGGIGVHMESILHLQLNVKFVRLRRLKHNDFVGEIVR